MEGNVFMERHVLLSNFKGERTFGGKRISEGGRFS